MASTPISKPTLINNIWSSGGNNTQPDITKIQTGWVAEIPPYQYFNWLWNRDSQAIAHINQMGVPVWDNLTQYIGGKSWCQGVSGTVYRAVQDSTGQNPDTDTSYTYWQIVDATTSGLNLRYLQRSNNLSDVNNPAQALINLGAAPKANPTFTGTVTLPNVGQYDSSQNAVYSAWVRAFGGGWSNVTIVSTAPSPVWGAGYVLNSASAMSVTMPAPAAGTSGRAILILNIGAGAATLTFPSTVQALGGTTVSLLTGDSIQISNDGTNIIAASGSVQLATSSLIRGMKTDITNLQSTSGNSVQKSGDTMTGPLQVSANFPAMILNKSVSATNGAGYYLSVLGKNRWASICQATTESGSNTGSGYSLSYYNDDGSYAGDAITAQRTDGRVSFPQGINGLYVWGTTTLNGAMNVTGIVSVTSGYATISAPSTSQATLVINASNGWAKNVTFTQNGVARWQAGGTSDSETSVDGVGSNWYISRYRNDGSFFDSPLIISRSTGQMSLTQRPQWNGLTPWDNGNFNPANYSTTSNTVMDVRLGAEQIQAIGVNVRVPDGFVQTGMNCDVNIGGNLVPRQQFCRPIQKNIQGVWYTVAIS